MATAIKITYEGQDIALYDKTVEALGMQAGIHGAPGLLFHWVESTDTGFVVHDVWESEEAFAAFKSEKLDALGMPDPTSVSTTDVYNYLR